MLKESNQKYGQTLILVTHDESIALQADRIITIADGRVVRDGRVSQAGKTAVNGRISISRSDEAGHDSTGFEERQVAQR